MTNQEFINTIAPIIQKYCKEFGFGVPSAIIAQACLESDYGTSNKAKHHNYFGLKYRENRVTCHTGYFLDGSSEEISKGNYVPITTNWYAFENMDKGVRGYFEFVGNGPYYSARQVEQTNHLLYLQELKSCGYATSYFYVKNIEENVIEPWKLTKFDNLDNAKKEDKGMKLFIIAGHGEGDPGACGNGYEEAERVRALASRIKAYGGDSVIIGDTSKKWSKRNLCASYAFPSGCKVLELHMDSGAPTARGGHVIIKAGFSADGYDKALADLMAKVFPGRANTTVGRSDLINVNACASRGINYRLMECGFISNAEDVKVFNAKIDELAKGICECFGIPVEKPQTQTVTEGNVMTLLADMNVRKAPVSGAVVKVLKKGTVINPKDVSINDKAVWIKTDDGWIYAGKLTDQCIK